MLTRRLTIRSALAAIVTLLALCAPADADSVRDPRLPDWRSLLGTMNPAETTSAFNAADATPADASVALPQERYYGSYGTPDRAPAASAGATALAPDGFNWDDAAIGAGGAVAIMLLGGAGMTLRHRHDARTEPRAIVSSSRR